MTLAGATILLSYDNKLLASYLVESHNFQSDNFV